MSFNRYKDLVSNGQMALVPFIEIPARASDIYIYYKRGKSRLDLLSYQYYRDPNYDWLILQANPNLDGLEFLIKDNTLIRIPFPLEDVLAQYQSDLENYKKSDGLETEL